MYFNITNHFSAYVNCSKRQLTYRTVVTHLHLTSAINWYEPCSVTQQLHTDWLQFNRI